MFAPNAARLGCKEELPELRREGIRLVDETPPEGCHAPTELLPSDFSGMDAGLELHEILTAIV